MNDVMNFSLKTSLFYWCFECKEFYFTNKRKCDVCNSTLSYNFFTEEQINEYNNLMEKYNKGEYKYNVCPNKEDLICME